MKSLVIQIQPDRAPQLDIEGAVTRLTAKGEDVSVVHGNDNGLFVNLTFKTASVAELWPRLEHLIQSVPHLSTAAIATCEGEQGWDDYWLLYHFNSEEALDEAPEE